MRVSMLFSKAPFLAHSDPTINHIGIESPYITDPNRGDLPLSGILTESDLVEFQVSGYFLGCHDVGHRQILSGVRCSYDCLRTVTDEYYSYIRFGMIIINEKYLKSEQIFSFKPL